LQQQINNLNQKVGFLIKENEFLRNNLINHQFETAVSDVLEITSSPNTVAETPQEVETSKEDIAPVPLTLELFRQKNLANNTDIYDKLIAAIKPEFHYTISNNSLYDCVKVLLFIHNTPNATIMQLRTASTLSDSGFAKQMARLKQKGYLLKEGTKTMVLTQKAIDMMYVALKDSPLPPQKDVQ